MKLSGKKSTADPGRKPVKQRTFSERFQTSDFRQTVQINTGSVQVFPDLEQNYKIIHTLDTGGNAVVSLAEDRFLKRIVALKSLKAELSKDPVRRRAFLREAQIMAQLEHPGIVPVYGIVRDTSGRLHIVMKRVQGKSVREFLSELRDLYRGNRLSRQKEWKSLHDRLELFLRICDAVAFAHSKRVLHGDLKPGNIMIENEHDIYVMDWGNAAILEHTADQCILKDMISGTPGYLSPEAVRGECTDYRSEVFTLGLILFELVTLSRAVTGKNSREILLKIRDGKRNPLRHRYGFQIAPELRMILKKALEPDREKRYDSVLELSTALRDFLTGSSD